MKRSAISEFTMKDNHSAWLSTAGVGNELSWIVGSKVVSNRTVRECQKAGWSRPSTNNTMEITDTGRSALASYLSKHSAA